MKKKKMKLKVGRLIAFIILVILGVACLLLLLNPTKTNNFVNKSKTEKVNGNITENANQEKEYTIKLLATGDGLVHSNIYKSCYKNGVYDFTKPVSLIKNYISKNKYDLAYYNQETVFGGADLGYSGYPLFNTPSEYGDAMIDAGFNVVSLATNHSLDRSTVGATNHVNYWQNKDVLVNGMANSLEQRDNIIIKEKNHIKYALLSYTTSTNGLKVPNDKPYLLNVYNEEQVKKDITSIRDKVDVLIVAMHWGVEYTHEPTAEQKQIAQYLASLDVDIVLGNHPHVIEPYEKIDGTLVFYSHGNFISNQPEESQKVGMMSLMTITKKVKDNESTIEINDVSAELIYTYNNVQLGSDAYYLVIPFSEMHDETYLKNYQTVHEKYANIIKKYDNSINVLAAG